MASVGTVVIEVDADVAKFVEGIKKTNTSINKLEKRAKEAKETIANWAKAVAGIYVVGKAFEVATTQAQAFLETASDFERYENGLSSFYIGQNNLNEAMERGKSFADEFNISVQETFESMHKMKVYGIEPTTKRLEEYGNVGLGAMKSVDQYVEMMADAMMGEFERTKEFGVKASQTAKRVQFAWSDSSGKARKIVVDNNQKIIQSTLETIFNEKYVGQLEKYKDSWRGFTTGLQTDYQLFQKSVMDAGIFDYIKDVTTAFKGEWVSAIGDTQQTAEMFSDYMKEMIRGSIESVAFLVDAWTGVKLVWNLLEVGFFGFVSAVGDGINWTANKWGEFSVFMHNSYKDSVDGMWKIWYDFMNFLGIDIAEVVKMWDSFTTILGGAWDSFTNSMATGFEDSVNFIIEKFNSVLDAFIGLGSDTLEFFGFDKLEKLSVPLVSFKKSIEETKAPLNVYISDIERATHETEKLVDFKFSNEVFADAKKNVAEYYDTLQNNSAVDFVDNVFKRMEDNSKKTVDNSSALTAKTKEAKDALADLLKTSAGTLESEKKKNEAKDKGNNLSKEANKLLKEAKKAEEDRIRVLEDFENVYKKSTLSNYKYKLQLLESEKEKYIDIGAERLKIDEWYNIEFEKLEDLKNKKLQDSWDQTSTHQKQLFEAYQESIQKQIKAENDLNNARERGLQTIFDGILAGDKLSNVLHNAVEGFNKDVANSFSDSITNSIAEAFKSGSSVDFGIFDDKGGLTSVGMNGAMALGNMFVKSAFGDNKNVQRGAEFGQAIGFALGGQVGAIGGQLGGAILGSMMGGEKSYYTRVTNDGKVEAHERISGGIFSSSSDKILSSETRQLQLAFDSTINSYEALLSSLFGFTDDLEILAGRYSSGELLNSIVPQAVIDSWTNVEVTHQDLSLLEGQIKERNRLVESLNSVSIVGVNRAEREAEIERYNQSIWILADKYNATITQSIMYWELDSTVVLNEAEQVALDNAKSIKDAWTAYAELAFDKDFNKAFIETMQNLENANIQAFETLFADDEVKVLQARVDRTKATTDRLTEQLQALYDDSLGSITLENYQQLEDASIQNGATPEQILAWTNLGDALSQSTQQSRSLADAIKAEDDARAESELRLRESQAVGSRAMEDWIGTFNVSEIEKARYEQHRANEDYARALGETTADIHQAKDFLRYINEASTQEEADRYIELASLYRANEEAQLRYSTLLNESNESVSTITTSLEELKSLMDSYRDIELNFSDFNNTLNMSDSEKLQYQINTTSHELGLIGVTFENFGSLLNGIQSDVEAGTISSDDLNNWSSLNSLIQQQYTLQQSIEEERIKSLETERDEIIKMGQDISSSMSSIITDEINRIKSDYDSRSSAIDSLRQSQQSYQPISTVYQADIYSTIATSDYDDNGSIESSIKLWHSQQSDTIKDLDDKNREAYEAEKQRLIDAENLRVENANKLIDARNEEIQATNALVDTIQNMKDSVSTSFSDIFASTSEQLQASLYSSISSKNYDDISGSFSSFASSVQSDSYLSDSEKFIKIAYANQAVQDIAEPVRQTELEHIEAKTIQIADYTSTLVDDQKAIDLSASNMYDALIIQNENSLPNVEQSIRDLFDQNRQYFEAGSDFYSFLERGATELTYIEEMNEQRTLWSDYQAEAREFNSQNLGTLSRIELNLNRENPNQKLEQKIDKLQKAQEEANKINKALLDAQIKSNEIAEKTANNTEKELI